MVLTIERDVKMGIETTITATGTMEITEATEAMSTTKLSTPTANGHHLDARVLALPLPLQALALASHFSFL
jgi:hypothetical protein